MLGSLYFSESCHESTESHETAIQDITHAHAGSFSFIQPYNMTASKTAMQKWSKRLCSCMCGTHAYTIGYPPCHDKEQRPCKFTCLHPMSVHRNQRLPRVGDLTCTATGHRAKACKMIDACACSRVVCSLYCCSSNQAPYRAYTNQQECKDSKTVSC